MEGIQARVYASGRKLSDEQVREIRALHALGMSERRIWDRYDIGMVTIRRICRGETWKHLLPESETAAS